MQLLFEKNGCISETRAVLCNEVDIRNQPPRLRRNTLILVENAGGCKAALRLLNIAFI